MNQRVANPSPFYDAPAAPASVLEILKANRIVAVATALFVFCWVLVYAFVVHRNQYVSNAMVLVKDSAVTSRYVVSDQNYALQTTTSNASNPVFNTMNLLKSTTVSDALWEYFKVNHPEVLQKYQIKDQQDWRGFFGDGKAFIKAKNQIATDMISLQLTWDDPKISQGALEVVVKAFQETSLTINRAEQQNRSHYLSVRIKELEAQVETLRRKKSAYKVETNAVNLSKESESLTTSSIEIATKLNQVESQARGKEVEYRRYQAMIGLSPENALAAAALGQNKELNTLHDKLYQLSQSYAQLKIGMTDKNPRVQEVTAQIEDVKKSIAAEMARTLRMTPGLKRGIVIKDGSMGKALDSMVTARVDAIRLYTEAEVLGGRLAQIREQIKALPTKEEDLANLEDQEKSLSGALANLRQKEIEAQLKQAETLSNIFVINAPDLPQKHKFPTQMHVLILGLMASVGAGLVAAWGKYQLTHAVPVESWATGTTGTMPGGVGSASPRTVGPPAGPLGMSTPAPRSAGDVSMEWQAETPSSVVTVTDAQPMPPEPVLPDFRITMPSWPEDPPVQEASVEVLPEAPVPDAITQALAAKPEEAEKPSPATPEKTVDKSLKKRLSDALKEKK